uniref:Pseudoazurin n=1 Tax=Paracoccus sp. SY TaxID=1330255 RepID=A0A0F6TMU2_9RHOB|nr:pseudoazurin [Paracoccus sp. SY]
MDLGDFRVHALARLFRHLGGLGGVQVRGRIAHLDQSHHAHRVMRGAFDAVKAGLGHGQRIFLVDLAFEGLDALGQDLLDRFDVVALVGGHEADHVARLGLHIGGFEHHHSGLALVQHVDLVFGREGGACEGQDKGGGCKEECAFHLLSPESADRLLNPLVRN